MSRQPRFEQRPNRKPIESRKLDLRRVKQWLSDSKNLTQEKLIIELIIDHLRTEKYPDGKTLQCELTDLRIESPRTIERLVRKLWDHLEAEQDWAGHSAKYQKTSTDCGSRVATGFHSQNSYSYRHHSEFYRFSYPTNHS